MLRYTANVSGNYYFRMLHIQLYGTNKFVSNGKKKREFN